MSNKREEFYSGLRDLPEFMGLELSPFTKNAIDSAPLHVAAIRSDDEIVYMLLKDGADPNARGEHGYTPLHEAIEQDHFNTARSLIDGGASIEIANEDWVSPRQLLADRGWSSLIKS